jgi:RNA polymerase sigma-70 factor (sigma-E family)
MTTNNVDADFTAYVAARGPTLVRLARRLLRDPDHAEDVTQEVLARAYRRWDQIRSGGHPDAYLRAALVNESISFSRRAVRRETAIESPTPAVGRSFDDVAPGAGRHAGDPAQGHAAREQALALLRRLPDRQRAVLVLRLYEDLSDDRIAEVMGITSSTVRSTAHRGLATLRQFLTHDGIAVPGLVQVPAAAPLRPLEEVRTHD